MDDGDVYVVTAYPALMPLFMTHLPGSLLMQLFLAVVYRPFWTLIGAIVRDPRWKVVVARRPDARATMFHAVHLEYYESSNAAQARQGEIVRRWQRGQFTASTPMTSRELGRARHETRSGRPVPMARTLAGYSLTRMRARASLAQGITCVAIGLGMIVLDFDLRWRFTGCVAALIGLVILVFGFAFWMRDRATRSTT